MQRKVDYYTYALLIIFFGAVIRFVLALNNVPAGDSTWHLNVARFLVENGHFPTFEHLGREVFSYPPLFYYFAAGFYYVFSVFGASVGLASMKLVSPLFGSLTLLLTFFLVKELSNEKIAFYATIFMTFLPIHIFMSSIAHQDATFAFFIILAVYCALKGRFFFSAISIGLANNIRFYGIILLPLIFFMLYKKKRNEQKKFLFNFFQKEYVKPFIFICLIVFFLSAPWFIRNYIELGNPIYPAFQYVFDAKAADMQQIFSPSLSNLFHEKYLTRIYLEFFGVPNGEWQNLFIFSSPLFSVLLILWFIGTILFLVPFFFYKKSSDSFKNNMLLIWASLFLLFMILIAIEINTYTRHFLPALPVLAFIWGTGLDALFKKVSAKKIMPLFVVILLIGILAGFLIVEGAKNTVAAKGWERYETDFAWVEQNTPAHALFYWNTQILSYHLYRETIFSMDEIIMKKQYVWTQEATDAQGKSSSLPFTPAFLNETNSILIYENNNTKTRIYRII